MAMSSDDWFTGLRLRGMTVPMYCGFRERVSSRNHRVVHHSKWGLLWIRWEMSAFEIVMMCFCCKVAARMRVKGNLGKNKGGASWSQIRRVYLGLAFCVDYNNILLSEIQI